MFTLGVFLLIVGGIIVGCFLLIVEIVFKRQKEGQETDEFGRPALIQWKKIDVTKYVRSIKNQPFLSFLLERPK